MTDHDRTQGPDHLTPDEMVESFRRLGASSGGRRLRRGKPRWIIPLVLLLLLGGVGLTWWLLVDREPALLRLAWPDFRDPDETWHFNVNSRRFLVIAKPGAAVRVRADAVSGSFTGLDVEQVQGTSASFQAPGEGACREVTFVGVDEEENAVECRVAILSVISGSPGEILGRDKAGAYPNPAKAGAKKIRENPRRYTPPELWIPVSGLELWPVSENFVLGDFMGDRLGRKETPPFIALDYRLLWKLERIEKALQEAGIAFRSMRVISGFREPLYNRSKKISGSKYSRHQYGDAADFIIDRDRDRKWDDLDGDGNVGFNDVKIVARLIEDLEMDGYIPPGGIAAYRGSKDSVLGSVHVDCRGVAARWGNAWSKGKRAPIEWWSDKYKGPDDDDKDMDSETKAPLKSK